MRRRRRRVSPSTGYSAQTHVVGNGASGIARSRRGRRRWLGDKQSFKSVAKLTTHKAINSKVNGICSNDEHVINRQEPGQEPAEKGNDLKVESRVHTQKCHKESLGEIDHQKHTDDYDQHYAGGVALCLTPRFSSSVLEKKSVFSRKV